MSQKTNKEKLDVLRKQWQQSMSMEDLEVVAELVNQALTADPDNAMPYLTMALVAIARVEADAVGEQAVILFRESIKRLDQHCLNLEKRHKLYTG